MNNGVKFRVWDVMMGVFIDLSDGVSYDSIFNDKGFVIQLFTGLYDKYKNPIFEGDIVEFVENSSQYFDQRFLVEIGNDFYLASWQLRRAKTVISIDDLFVVDSQSNHVKVVGTIFDRKDIDWSDYSI